MAMMQLQASSRRSLLVLRELWTLRRKLIPLMEETKSVVEAHEAEV
jgi:hypothetical protein